MLQAEACNTDTTPTQPHRISNTHWTKNNTTNVVKQQNSRRLLMLGTSMSETCCAHKKWNKIASDIKLVFCSSIMGMFRFWLKPDNNNTRFMMIYVQLEYLAMVGLWDGRHSLWGTTYGWRIDRWSWLNVTVQCRCLRRIDFKSFFLEYFEDDGLWICCEHTEKPDRYCVLKHSVCNVWKVFTETTFRQK